MNSSLSMIDATPILDRARGSMLDSRSPRAAKVLARMIIVGLVLFALGSLVAANAVSISPNSIRKPRNCT